MTVAIEPADSPQQTWIRIRFAGEQVSRHYRTEEDPNGDFNGAVADHVVVEDGPW